MSFDGETGGRSRDTHGLWVTLGTLSTELADEAVLGGCLVIVCADLSFIDAVSGESEATRKLDDAVASIRRLGGAVLLLDTAPAR